MKQYAIASVLLVSLTAVPALAADTPNREATDSKPSPSKPIRICSHGIAATPTILIGSHAFPMTDQIVNFAI